MSADEAEDILHDGDVIECELNDIIDSPKKQGRTLKPGEKMTPPKKVRTLPIGSPTIQEQLAQLEKEAANDPLSNTKVKPVVVTSVISPLKARPRKESVAEQLARLEKEAEEEEKREAASRSNRSPSVHRTTSSGSNFTSPRSVHGDTKGSPGSESSYRSPLTQTFAQLYLPGQVDDAKRIADEAELLLQEEKDRVARMAAEQEIFEIEEKERQRLAKLNLIKAQGASVALADGKFQYQKDLEEAERKLRELKEQQEQDQFDKELKRQERMRTARLLSVTSPGDKVRHQELLDAEAAELKHKEFLAQQEQKKLDAEKMRKQRLSIVNRMAGSLIREEKDEVSKEIQEAEKLVADFKAQQDQKELDEKKRADEKRKLGLAMATKLAAKPDDTLAKVVAETEAADALVQDFKAQQEHKEAEKRRQLEEKRKLGLQLAERHLDDNDEDYNTDESGELM